MVRGQIYFTDQIGRTSFVNSRFHVYQVQVTPLEDIDVRPFKKR